MADPGTRRSRRPVAGSASDAPGDTAQSAAARRRFVLATVIDAVSSGLWVPFALLFFVRAQGIPLVGAGAALTTGGLTGLAATPAAGIAADRFGLIPVMVTCNVIRFAGFTCYPFVTGAWQIVPIAAVIAAGDRLFWTVNTPMVKALTTGRRAEYLIGTQTIARFAGAGAGAGAAAVLSALTSRLVYHLLAYLNAASFVAAALLVAGLRRTDGLAQRRPAGSADRAGPARCSSYPGASRRYLRQCC
jgi:MFS family permease